MLFNQGKISFLIHRVVCSDIGQIFQQTKALVAVELFVMFAAFEGQQEPPQRPSGACFHCHHPIFCGAGKDIVPCISKNYSTGAYPYDVSYVSR